MKTPRGGVFIRGVTKIGSGRTELRSYAPRPYFRKGKESGDRKGNRIKRRKNVSFSTLNQIKSRRCQRELHCESSITPFSFSVMPKCDSPFILLLEEHRILPRESVPHPRGNFRIPHRSSRNHRSESRACGGRAVHSGIPHGHRSPFRQEDGRDARGRSCDA